MDINSGSPNAAINELLRMYCGHVPAGVHFVDSPCNILVAAILYKPVKIFQKKTYKICEVYKGYKD